MLDISPVQYPETQVSVPYRGATFLNTPSFFVITPLKARFPSPIGELHFSMQDSYSKEFTEFKFPSPIGELHFSMKNNYLNNLNWGFRPLSGSYISQYLNGQFQQSSPLVFPSPIGELHFSIFYFISPAIHARVSVPYRGATFLNSQVVLLAVIFVCVSVPYRGATFLNMAKTFDSTRIQVKFPSPIGELHFSIRPRFLCLFNVFHGFRPLSGSYISQQVPSKLYQDNKNVSVPYRGATFLNGTSGEL